MFMIKSRKEEIVMEIKVLGTGCANCKRLLGNVNECIDQLKIQANVIYVTDLIEISKTGILRTPGLMINGKIVSYGKVNTIEEISELISRNQDIK